MKHVILVMSLAAIISCGQKKQPALAPDTVITPANASQVVSFDNTPESVVMYFYASMIRGDKAWEKVCPDEPHQSKMFRGKMDRDYSHWNFIKYHFVKKEEFEKDHFYVTIYMEILVDGKTEDGEDQVTVEKINGKWKVVDIPT